MKNDYKRTDFAEVINNNKKEYYIKVKNKWILVSKDIFKVCKNSYLKSLRNGYRDNNKISNYENFDLASSFTLDNNNLNIVDKIYLSQMKTKLYNALNLLTEKEYFIIKSIYFDELTEREIAFLLNISQPALHYQKKKILKN